MKSHSSAVLVFVVLLWGVACRHADTVADTNATHGEAPVTGKEVPVKLPAAKTVTPKVEEGHPPLATVPSQLLTTGTPELVGDKLKAMGFLSPKATGAKALEAAVRKFQESQGLAATGFTDHETLKRLGIDPEEADKTARPETGTAKEPPGQPPEQAKQR